MRITGTLFSETDAETTRLYCAEDYGLQMAVVYAYDRKFMEDCRRHDRPGLYFLIWPDRLYIGQSRNVCRRVLQHMDAGRDFDCACLFTKTDAPLTQTQTAFLEYLTIKDAVECGRAPVMENCQLPHRPVITPDDEWQMMRLAAVIRLMMQYAGFKDVFGRRLTTISTEDYDSCRRRTMSGFVADTGQETSGWRCCEDGSDNNDDRPADVCDDETEVLVSYKAFDAGRHYDAHVIPVSGGFMIMPGSVIVHDTSRIPALADELHVPDLSNKLRLSPDHRLTVASGFILPTLETMSVLVTGNSDPFVWQMLRQVVE